MSVAHRMRMWSFQIPKVFHKDVGADSYVIGIPSQLRDGTKICFWRPSFWILCSCISSLCCAFSFLPCCAIGISVQGNRSKTLFLIVHGQGSNMQRHSVHSIWNGCFCRDSLECTVFMQKLKVACSFWAVWYDTWVDLVWSNIKMGKKSTLNINVFY